MSTPTKPNSAAPVADGMSSEIINTFKGQKPSDREKQIIAWTKDAHDRCRTIRQQIERQWYINLAFYTGRQNVAVIPISSASSAATGVRLYIPPAPYYRARPIFNRIRPIIRKELARLTAQKPSATIIPSTSEEQDQAAARAGEQIWESTFRRKKLKVIHRQAQLWALTTGIGFVKCYWDANLLDNTQPKSPPTEMNLNPTAIPGDFVYEVVTPFHLFVPDMLATDIEDQPYVIHLTTRTPEWVRLHYPGVNPVPNVMEANDILNDSFLNLVGAGDFRKNAVLCYEVWVKPGHLEHMPMGGMYQIIGDRIVQFVEGNPYKHGRYPFSKLDHIPNNRFYSDSVTTDLIPVQREYNRTRGQIIEAKNRMAHPQIIAAEGSVDASRITTEPGQIIFHKLGFPVPQPFPLQGIPSYVIQEIQQQLIDFDDISGQHDVSKGQTPPGVTAATAINFLQEQDETMLAPSFQSIEEFFEDLAFKTLSYVQQYWDTPRMVRVAGRDKSFDVIAFQGTDLRDNTDINIEAGSSLPTSKAAKQAFLMDLMQLQFISPEQGLELMDMGGTQELYEQIQIDSAHATRENMKMANVTQDVMSQYLETFQGVDPATGQPTMIDPNTGGPLVDSMGSPVEPPLIVPVNSFDNHMAHIKSHNNYRKSQEYDSLPPEIKNLFEQHVNQHMAALGLPPGMPDPTTNAPQIPMNQDEQMATSEEPTTDESITPPVATEEVPPGPPNPMMGGVPSG